MLIVAVPGRVWIYHYVPNSALNKVGEIKTVRSNVVNLAFDTEKSIASVTVNPGTYLFIYSAYFSANSKGHRRINLNTTQNSNANDCGTTLTLDAVSVAIGTVLSRSRIIKFDKATTEYLTVSQSSDSSLSVQGQIEVLRIK